MAKLQFIKVSSAGHQEHVVVLCPTCRTICDIHLRPDGRIVFECGTLDCSFEHKFSRAEALSQVE